MNPGKKGKLERWRREKITGDFGEYLVLYWLSKCDFACARVDHVGIDLIAKKRGVKRMGIAVQTRSRLENEREAISVYQRRKNAIEGCKPFDCKPYFAFVVDDRKNSKIRLFIIKDADLGELKREKLFTNAWRMSAKALKKYADDSRIKWVEFSYFEREWWGKKRKPISNIRRFIDNLNQKVNAIERRLKKHSDALGKFKKRRVWSPRVNRGLEKSQKQHLKFSQRILGKLSDTKKFVKETFEKEFTYF